MMADDDGECDRSDSFIYVHIGLYKCILRAEGKYCNFKVIWMS